MEAKSRSIVFLDRDGTINVDSGYVCDPDEVELLPGAADAIAQMRSKGFAIVVVSNQSAVGRGYASVEDVEATNARVQQMLYSQNPDAKIDLWCYAPDHPEQATAMRKPGIGMLGEVRKRFDFDVVNCWMVGDKSSDVEFGLNAGIPPEHCVFLYPGLSKPEAQNKAGDCPELGMTAGVHILESLSSMLSLSEFS